MARDMLNLHRLIKASAKPESVPISDIFLNDLQACVEHIDLAEQTKRAEVSTFYSPSSMQCIRAMYFKRVGEVKDNIRSKYNLINIGKSGTSRHKHIQRAIIKMAEFGMPWEFVDVAVYIAENNLTHLEVVPKLDDEGNVIPRTGFEVKLHDKELDLQFLCDGIVKYKGIYYILEIKTETQYKWNNRVNVSVDHQIQAAAYSKSLRIPNVIFLYENRDLCDWKCYLFEVTKEMQDEFIVKRIKECDSCAKAKIPPKVPVEVTNIKTSKMCKYCKYTNACKKYA